MNTNVFLTDRCELNSLGLVASLTEPAFGRISRWLVHAGLKAHSVCVLSRFVSAFNLGLQKIYRLSPVPCSLFPDI